MPEYTRNGNRWTVNECLQLQREYELLGLSIDEIASRHKRTINAIMFRLDHEGFADYNVLSSNYTNSQSPKITNIWDNEEDDSDDDEEEESEEDEESEEEEESEEDIKSHVRRLEKQVSALTELLTKSTKNKSFMSLFA